jgi:FemAB-related protein (PEP-CTERM system-associated)
MSDRETTIIPLNDALEPAWEDFVQGHEAAHWFHRAGWRRVVGRAYGHATPYLVARRGGEITGILPLVHVRSPLFGRALVSTGFGVEGGILARDEASLESLAREAVRLGERLGVGHVELRGGPAPAGWETRSGVYAGFLRELPATEADNLKAIPRKKRADVRKALGGDLQVEVGGSVAEFWRVYAESLRNLGTPVFPARFARAVVEEFPEETEISLVRHEGRAVAALLSFYFKDRVMPYYGGATPAARPVHAYDLLYWSLMRRAVGKGIRVFDFGRSKLGTGAFDYKRFWGFEPSPLTYAYRLVHSREIPNLNPLNPKYRAMVGAWQKLPLWAANRLGPILAAGLG